MNIQEEILKSMEVMIDKSLTKYNSTRTESAIVEDIKNGKYQVTVDGTKCYVYDSVGCDPKIGNAVWVQIPNGDFRNAFITGRRNKSVDGMFNGNNSQSGSGGGITVISDYNALNNRPSINGVLLEGNKTTEDLHITVSGEKTVVDINPLVKTGTHIADITVDGAKSELYAPTITTIDAVNVIEDPTHQFIDSAERTKWNNKADSSAIPTNLSQLQQDATHRLVTDDEKEKWNAGGGGTGTPTKIDKIFDGILRGQSFTNVTIPNIDLYDAIVLVGGYNNGTQWECINAPTFILKEDFYTSATYPNEEDWTFLVSASTTSYRVVVCRFINSTTLRYKANHENAAIMKIYGIKFGTAGIVSAEGSDISYDGSATGLSATTIQGAIDELYGKVLNGES